MHFLCGDADEFAADLECGQQPLPYQFSDVVLGALPAFRQGAGAVGLFHHFTLSKLMAAT
jgi:hypothetical protein